LAIAKKASTDIQRLEDQENRIHAQLFAAREIKGPERVVNLRRVAHEIEESLLLPTHKAELLEQCLPLTISAITELSDEYLRSTLPLSDSQIELINNIVALTETIDETYAAMPAKQRGLDARLIIHRRLRLLFEQLSFTAACYMPWTEKLWTRIHNLYLDARSRRATQYRAASIDKGPQEPTIERLYIGAVLTAAADPYQMGQSEILAVRTLAMAFGKSVSIEHTKSRKVSESNERRLLTDRRIDKPSVPNRVGKELDQNNIILDISECHEALSKRLESLQKKKNSKDPLIPEMRRSSAIVIYKHVLTKWDQQPKRFAERVAANDRFDLIVNYINIVEAFFTSEDEEQVAPLEDSHSAAAVTIDASETGYGLRVRTSADFQFGVGECIAMRDSNDGSGRWQLVVVRWIRNATNGDFEVGTFKLPGRLYAAKLLSIHNLIVASGSKSDAPQVIPVLVISDDDVNEPMKVQLLIHRIMDNGELPHWLTFAGSDRLIISMKLKMSTRDVAIYECELSKPRRRPIFDVKPEEKYTPST